MPRHQEDTEQDWFLANYSPITRLAEHVVVWHPDDFFIVKGHDTRNARDMRDHLSRYKRRCFSKPWEAGYSKIYVENQSL